ncbi:MAG: 1,4-alpha-glucan branching protein domain-containing protein [Myxococcota bacterium]
MPAGSFCLVLHGHLPWVLHHGNWPHGEVWLHEAVAETWLPLLAVCEELAHEGIRIPLTLGMMPVLLEQLRNEGWQHRFVRWLGAQMERAERDAAEFRGRGEPHLAYLADRWRNHYEGLALHFDAIGRDVPRAFAGLAERGVIELLTSNATHGYMPLLQHDACARAQVRAGVATSRRVLGFSPKGAWLPECAYRPGGPWRPPVVHGDTRMRAGVEEVFANEGVGFFFVDSHLFQGARSEGIVGPHGFGKVGWDQPTWDTAKAWRSVLEPHWVSSDGGPGRLVALARHPEVSEQVWSGEVGYPGDGRYLEFHKKHGGEGLRYWKVTGARTDLGDKQPYHPDDVQGAVYTQSQHFVATVRAVLQQHRDRTGRHGVVVAPFDAELFGHWWHEGPLFLREVFRAMHHDPAIEPSTVSRFLAEHPPDKVVTLPEGSWGEGGDHRVWINDQLRWTWEAEYRAEDRFLYVLHRLPWRTDPHVREAVEAAARELLLLQASDWQFVVHTGGAVDYGFRRFCEHLARFDRAGNVAEARARGEPDDALSRHALADIALHDPVFPDLDLEWWSA